MTNPWSNDKWWVSQLNFAENVRASLKLPSEVIVHDITLRDGEQQAGLVFDKEDKIKIARMLDEVGVHRIEAGMPAVSKSDKENMLQPDTSSRYVNMPSSFLLTDSSIYFSRVKNCFLIPSYGDS